MPNPSLFLCIIISWSSWTQSTSYELIPFGEHQVGFFDTLIFNEGRTYEKLGYSGPAPLFVQVWHPVKQAVKSPTITFGQFRERCVPTELDSVHSHLLSQMDSSMVWYGLSGDIITQDSLAFGGKTPYQALGSIKTLSTQSHRIPVAPDADFPVVLYHHGSQGMGDENHIMAEYLASRGFIVVSANFHLPSPPFTYGIDFEINGYDTASPKRLAEYARSLSSNPNLFFIGHSRGAQTGFSYLHEPGQADAFVSLESTLEYWDSAKIYDRWEALALTMESHHSDYQLPILMFANDGDEQTFEFEFFEAIHNAPMWHVSSRKAILHESYTSAFHLRYLLREELPQPDTAAMRLQLEAYARHLVLIGDFLQSCTDGKSWSGEKYRESFFVRVLNQGSKADSELEAQDSVRRYSRKELKAFEQLTRDWIRDSVEHYSIKVKGGSKPIWARADVVDDDNHYCMDNCVPSKRQLKKEQKSEYRMIVEEGCNKLELAYKMGLSACSCPDKRHIPYLRFLIENGEITSIYYRDEPDTVDAVIIRGSSTL